MENMTFTESWFEGRVEVTFNLSISECHLQILHIYVHVFCPISSLYFLQGILNAHLIHKN